MFVTAFLLTRPTRPRLPKLCATIPSRHPRAGLLNTSRPPFDRLVIILLRDSPLIRMSDPLPLRE